MYSESFQILRHRWCDTVQGRMQNFFSLHCSRNLSSNAMQWQYIFDLNFTLKCQLWEVPSSDKYWCSRFLQDEANSMFTAMLCSCLVQDWITSHMSAALLQRNFIGSVDIVYSVVTIRRTGMTSISVARTHWKWGQQTFNTRWIRWTNTAIDPWWRAAQRSTAREHFHFRKSFEFNNISLYNHSPTNLSRQ